MDIYGLQKMTLLDFPGKVACTVFTGGCNFRCPFCHNALLVTELRRSDRIDEKDFFSFLKKRKGLLDGVCVTGGEPLLGEEIIPFLRSVKELGYPVKLDTNGSFPERLDAILSEKLCDYVAMDIKNSPEKYAMTVGLKAFDIIPVKASASLLISCGTPYEFRTTVCREFHTEEDIQIICEWLSGAERYFLQSFEDSEDLIEKKETLHPLPKETLKKMLEIIRGRFRETGLRGESL